MTESDKELILTALWLDEFRPLSEREKAAFETFQGEFININGQLLKVLISSNRYGLHLLNAKASEALQSKVWDDESGNPLWWCEDGEQIHEYKQLA